MPLRTIDSVRRPPMVRIASAFSDLSSAVARCSARNRSRCWQNATMSSFAPTGVDDGGGEDDIFLTF